MICICPKCQAQIKIELHDVTEGGTTASCPACKSQFSVQRETFAGRALRSPGEMSCASCGAMLGPELHCHKCGIPFPEYLVVGGRKRAARSTGGTKSQLGTGLFGKGKKGSSSHIPSLQEAMQAEETAPKRKPLPAKSPNQRKLIAAVAAVVVLALALGGGWIFLQKRAEATYSRNFVLAAYGIQTGMEKSRKSCQKLAADWKGKIDAGQAGYVPKPSPDDEKDLNTLRGKVDKVKAAMGKEPEKFRDSRDQLGQLDGCFEKTRSLALSPGNSLPAFNDSLNKIDAQYRNASNNFKGNLPAPLMDALRAASDRYRGLKALLR